jgi:hypothetical protein
LKSLFFDFDSYLTLKCNYLRNEPLYGHAVLIENSDVPSVSLLMFSRVEFKQQFQEKVNLFLLFEFFLIFRDKELPQLICR